MRQDQSRYRESEWAELDLLVDEACTALADVAPHPAQDRAADQEQADLPFGDAIADAKIYAEIGALLAHAADPRALLERLLAEIPHDDASEEPVAESEAPDRSDESGKEKPDA